MTFANRWRVLQQQMIQFGSTVGTIFINAFKPVLRVLNRVMDAAIQFAETVLNALGAIFGWTYEISAAGISDDLGEMATDMGDIASGAGDTASGLGNAAKNAAKLKTQLQSFDRLNNLSSPGNTGSGGSGGSGGGGGGGGGSAGGAGALQIARHTGEGIIKAYESAIKSLEELGTHISIALRDTLRGIDWDSVYEGARNFGTGLAQFLNGLIRPDTFYEVGKAIANSINTALEASFSFASTFKFDNLGVSIRSALMGFFQNFNWDLAKANIREWLGGLATAINNLITPELFSEIGKFLSQAVNTAFAGMKKFFVKLDGKNIGVSLANGANSFIDGLDTDEIAGAINHALQDVWDAAVSFAENLHWEDVWDKATEVLGKLDIPGVDLLIGGFTLLLASKIAIGAGKLLLGAKVLEWLGVAAAGTGGAAAMTGVVSAATGALAVSIPLALTVVAAGALEFLAPEDNTAGKKVMDEMLRELRYAYDPSDPGNDPLNLPIEFTPEYDKDIWDATLPEIIEDLGKGIQSKFDEFMRDHPLLAKVFGYKFEDHIPENEKDIYGGTSHPAHADSTHIPQSERNIDNGLITVTQSDLLKVPEAHRILPNGRINVTDANTGSVPEAKRTINGPLKVTSVNQSGLSTAQKTINNAIAKLSGKNGINAGSVKKTIPGTYTAAIKKLTKAAGFTGISLSGTVRGGGGKVVATMKKEGGVFDNGKWSDIPRFADGGIPSVAYGSLFWAGEAGPELVGHVGGRTEVLNASQIAVAVSDGVARANNSVVNALAAQNRILVGILEKKTGISSRDIFTAVRAEAANYQLRTGTPAFQ